MRILYCEMCGEQIPPHKVRKGGLKRQPRTCSVECLTALRKQEGYYKAISVLGNAAQARYKAEHGHIPQYEHRAAATRASNTEHPRRKRNVVQK